MRSSRSTGGAPSIIARNACCDAPAASITASGPNVAASPRKTPASGT